MVGMGTIANVLAIVVGGCIGLLAKGGLKQSVQDSVIRSLGLATLFIGAGGALCGMLVISDGGLSTVSTRDTLFMILSLALGTLVGEFCDFDGKMEQLGMWLKARADRKGGDNQFVQGFVTASLVVCIGAMAIVGSIQDGLSGDRPPLKADEFITKPQPAAPQPTAQEVPKEEPAQEEEPQPSLEELLEELDSLCGLDQVKKDVKSLINLVKVRKLRQEAGLPVPPMSLHLVFLGNPGTGKTTVARLLAKIYRSMGVLPKGQLVEVDRSGLVAGFVGQTAIKTQEVIQKAIGGVLFIDEAYALVNQDSPNDFGHEAIEVLLKNMEDHRKDLIVIVAGYSELMEKFIHANPGLESRFNKYFYFADYDGGQLFSILESMCKKNGYTLSPEGAAWAKEDLERLYQERDENFGNARDVRNLFEKAVSRQSDRVAKLDAPTREQLMELLPEDLKESEDETT